MSSCAALAKTAARASEFASKRRAPPLASLAAHCARRQSDSNPSPQHPTSPSPITRNPATHAARTSRARADRRLPTSRNNETFSSVAEASSSDHRPAADRAPSARRGTAKPRRLRPGGVRLGTRATRAAARRARTPRRANRALGAIQLPPKSPGAVARLLPAPCRFAMLSEGSRGGDFDAASASRLASRP